MRGAVYAEDPLIRQARMDSIGGLIFAAKALRSKNTSAAPHTRSVVRRPTPGLEPTPRHAAKINQTERKLTSGERWQQSRWHEPPSERWLEQVALERSRCFGFLFCFL